MKREFVLVVNDDSPAAVKTTAESLSELSGVVWCHYIKGLWQIVDGDGTLTATKIQEHIREALPDTLIMVFQIQPGSGWSGWVPQKMAKWIKDNWE